MAITKDQIFAAADELDAAGQSATLAAVRKALGGGSFTTISDAMAEWKARKAARDTPLREPPPPTLVDRLGVLGAEIWSAALELANGRLESEREALEAARAQLEADKAEAAELADQVTAELEVAKKALLAADATERAARGEAEELRTSLGQMSVQAATAEARAREIEKRADDLNAELARVHQQNADLVAGLAAAAKPRPPSGLGAGKGS